jgi:hypothetical protein
MAMTDPPQSSPPAKTFWDRPRRLLQQGLGFVYGTLLLGILVNLVSNLLSFTSILNWITHYLFISGLIGGILLLLTVLAFWGDRRSLPAPSRMASPPLDPYDRVKLLKSVRRTWIEGLLEHSLHQAAWIDLCLQEQPDKLENPWRLQMQEFDREPHDLPVGTSIVKVYDEADGELLILGEPGAGKTTLLLQLARTLLDRAFADEHIPMPVVFNLSSWTKEKDTLVAWLVEDLETKYYVPHQVGQQWINAHRILPLLDGLDEVAKEARTDCIQKINDYQLKSNGNPIVVCCRSEEYDALSTRVTFRCAVSILPLTDSQINTYLEQAGEQVKVLKQWLDEDAELHDLARQPLMLNIFTLAYREATPTEMPAGTTREEMQRITFARYVERMLKRRKQSKRWKPEQVMRWLAFLAKQMQLKHLTTFPVAILQSSWLSRRDVLSLKDSSWETLYGRSVRWVSMLAFGVVGGIFVGRGFGLLFGLVGGITTVALLS